MVTLGGLVVPLQAYPAERASWHQVASEFLKTGYNASRNTNICELSGVLHIYRRVRT